MVIHNEIFESYRIEKKEIDKAIKLLKEKGYTILKTETKEIK